MERLPQQFHRFQRHHELRQPVVVLALSLALVVSLFLASSPTSMADDLDTKQKRLKRGIKDATTALAESSDAAAAAAAALQKAEAELAQARQRLATVEEQLRAAKAHDQQMAHKLQRAQARLVKARKQLRTGKAAVVQQRADLGRMAAQNFQQGDPQLMGLSVLLNSDDPQVLTTQLNTVNNLLEREATVLAALQVSEALLTADRNQVRAIKTEVELRRAEAAEALARTELLREQVANETEQVAIFAASQGDAAKQARLIRRRDMAKLKALRQEENRIRQLIAERDRQRSGGYTGSAAGLLLRPVPGRVTSGFGYRIHPIYQYYGLHDGTDFRAPCGTPLRAAASGTVIEAYFSPVWGSRLILDIGRVNGKPMTLIYNHISTYNTPVGAKVARGDILAYSGNSGWSTGCHLHFTVLRGGTPVNPMNYF